MQHEKLERTIEVEKLLVKQELLINRVNQLEHENADNKLELTQVGLDISRLLNS